MKVIITGGTGLIGRTLSAKLLAKHHDVYALSRNPAKYKDKVLNGVQLHQWDSQTAEGWAHLIDGDTAIVNLAAASIGGDRLFPPQRWTPQRKQLIRDSRVKAGQAVVAAVQQAEEKPRVVIQSSAIGYYGVENEDEQLTEDHPPADPAEDFLAGVCLAWERSTEPVEEAGVRRCVIRSGVVLSMRDGALPRIVLPFRFFAGGPLGSGNQWMSWIHIEDEARAILHLIEKEDASGPFNLTAPHPVRNHQLAKAIGQVLGRPAFMPAPALAIKLVFGELATTVLDGQRVIPKKLQDSGFSFEYEEIKPALEDLLKSD